MTAIQREPRREVWTTRRLLAWTTDRFAAREVDAPRVVAELLLAHALGCDRMRLYMEADRPATTDELTALRVLVQQASDHVPVQYLVGRASFFGHEFLVDRSTMIPQPCTETLVAAVIEFLQAGNGGRGGEPARVADVGTGSGCIAISVARSEQKVSVVGTDVVPEALDLARRNAAALGVAGRVVFEEGSLLEPLRPRADERPFDVICANLPYISDDEWEGGQVQRAVREHVPARALRAGRAGLDLIGPLIAEAGALLREGGLLALEIAHGQRDEILRLVDVAPDLERARVVPDTDGLDRVLLARRG